MTNRYSHLILFVLLGWSLTGCKGYAKYTIDDKPQIPVDAGLCGIWKITKDTSKYNYILIEQYQDVHPEIGKGNKYEPDPDKCYYLTYMNYHGTNPLYERWRSFISKVDNELFWNIRYIFDPGIPEDYPKNIEEGFFFERINKINATYDTMIVSTVADKRLRLLKNANEVRNFIAKNINVASFYSDTVQLYKVTNYHGNIWDSRKYANPEK